MTDQRQAFKIGFCLKLAEVGLTPSQLVRETQKLAFNPVGPALILGGVPMLGGRAVGQATGSALGLLSDDELDTIPEARREYLLKRYRDLIRQRRAELETRLMAQAKREVPA